MKSLDNLIRQYSGFDERYYIMNKDRPIYEFRFTSDNSIQILDVFEKPPFWIKSPQEWMEKRNAAKHRNDIKKILDDSGANTLKGFTLFTRCLSVNDTLWVRPVNADYKWENVNLYKNEFRESIGFLMAQVEFRGTSDPTFSTDGQFPKCWEFNKECPVLFKGGRTGKEPFAECFASKLKLAYARVVEYTVAYRESKYMYGTLCKAFTNESVMFLPYSIVSEDFLINEVESLMGKYNSDDSFRDMLLLDAVTMNTDRHFRNFGFVLDSDNYNILGMAPIFDMNYCYGSADLFSMRRPISDYLNDNRSRMFGDFIEAIRGRVSVDSLYSIEESLKEIEQSGIPYCEDWFFERMVEITKIQINKIKEML